MKQSPVTVGIGAAMWLAVLACGLKEKQDGPAEKTESRATARATTEQTPLAAAESVYYRGEYDSAKLLLRPLAEESRRRGDTATAARALTWLGLTAWREGDYAAAREIGERALDLKLRIGLKSELFRSYNALGLLAHNQGRYTDALSHFSRAEAAAREVGDSAGIAKTFANRGLSYVEIGEFDKARAGFDALRQMGEQLGDTRSEANALANLAMLDIRLGDPVPAISALERARVLYRNAKNPAGEENVLGQLGTAFEVLGDPRRSMAYLDSALAVATEHGLAQQESEDLQIVAGIFGGVGDHSRALEYLARARVISEKLGQTSELGDIAATQARALASIGRLDAAMTRATEARDLHGRSDARTDVMRDNLLIAELAQNLGQRVRATAAMNDAERIAKSLDVRIARAEFALGKARVADSRGDPGAVLAALGNFETDIGSAGSAVQWEAHALRARAYRRSGSVERAAASGRLAVAKLEEVRGRIGSGPLRTLYISERAGVYADLTVTLLEMNRISEAFGVADAARSRGLLEHISAARRTLETVSGKRLVEADRLLRRIDWLVERLQESDTLTRLERGGVEYANLSALEGRLASARREYESLMYRIQSGDPRAAAILGGTATELASVQRVLSADEILLQFLVSSDRIVSFVVTRDTVVAIQTAVRSDEVASRARLAIDAARTSSAGDKNMRAIFRRLHELLIEPAEGTGLFAGKRTLIIVPHASTVHLPFAALIDGTGDYLVERYAPLTLSSAGVLYATRLTAAAADNRTASVLAPFPDQLPGTRVEAKLVANRVGGMRAFVGPDATEKVLRNELQRSAIVHVASHGLLNEITPMFSRVELAMSRARVPSDDGRLEVHEILGLSLRNGLVFLSGCETASGLSWSTSFRRSQDYATLSQAFLFAGARDVIATLWRIDDRSAADIAARFYARLRSRSPVASLAEAQREMIRDRRYAAPRHWAAYTISGAGTAAPPVRIAVKK